MSLLADTYSINTFRQNVANNTSQVERNLAKVDCVIEVHDARAPLSGRNAKFLERLRVARPHLLVLNKSDMIPKRTIAPLVKHIVDTGKFIGQYYISLGRSQSFSESYMNRRFSPM